SRCDGLAPSSCATRPSFETPASPAPQDEGALSKDDKLRVRPKQQALMLVERRRRSTAKHEGATPRRRNAAPGAHAAARNARAAAFPAAPAYRRRTPIPR